MRLKNLWKCSRNNLSARAFPGSPLNLNRVHNHFLIDFFQLELTIWYALSIGWERLGKSRDSFSLVADVKESDKCQNDFFFWSEKTQESGNWLKRWAKTNVSSKFYKHFQQLPIFWINSNITNFWFQYYHFAHYMEIMTPK